MKTADKFLSDAATLYAERNAVYGNNWVRFGKAMKAIFPDGIKLESEDDFARFQLFTIQIAKQTRYANNWDKGGHADSSSDITVYSAMLTALDADIKERKPA